MAGLNKVMIIGNLGRDPEMRYLPSGTAVTTFPVAVSRSWKNAEGQVQEETEWFNVVAWDKRAEFANEYLRKGRRVYIEGRLRTRSYEDRNTGEKRYWTEVVASDIQFLDSRTSTEAEEFGPPEPEQGLDEIPF
jgi:single-strand DNA-binding protein